MSDPMFDEIWASLSGANVVSGLTLTSAAYAGPALDSRINYNLVTYQASGSPDLSGVLFGHRLTVSGFANAENNGANRFITAVDNTAKTITIRTTAVSRSDSSLDETGASASGSVANSGSSREAPSPAKQQQGAVVGEKFPAAYFNWFMHTVSKQMSAKKGFAHVGYTSLSSNSYINVDGAGVPFAASVDTVSSTYTPSANDAAYETLTGTSETISTQANRILHLLTAQMDAQTIGPGALRYRVDSTDVYTFNFSEPTNPNPIANSTFSMLGLSSGLSAGSHTSQFQVNRKTGRTFSKIRSSAFEMRPTDDAGNSLIYASGIASATQTIANANTYEDVTNLSVTQTFNSNTSVLIFSAFNAETGSVSNGGFRMLLDGSALLEQTYTGPLRDESVGEAVLICRLHDLATPGSHTIKMQAKSSGNITLINQANTTGLLYCLELPDTYQGAPLLRFKTDIASANTSSSAAAAFATTGARDTSGNYVVLMLSGKVNIPNNTQAVYFQFKVDGVATDDEYIVKFGDDFNGDKFFTIFFVTETKQSGSHTYSVDWRTSMGTATAGNVQFAAFEICQKDPLAAAAASITLPETTGKKIELEYTGILANTATAAIGLRFAQDGMGVGQKLEFTPQSNIDAPFCLRTIIDAPTEGSSPVFTVQGKTASGTLLIDAADFTAIEIPGT